MGAKPGYTLSRLKYRLCSALLFRGLAKTHIRVARSTQSAKTLVEEKAKSLVDLMAKNKRFD